jgi:hypothetical protein
MEPPDTVHRQSADIFNVEACSICSYHHTLKRGNDFCCKVVLRGVDYEVFGTEWVRLSGFCRKLNDIKEFSGQDSNQQLLKSSLQDCSNMKGAGASLTLCSRATTKVVYFCYPVATHRFLTCRFVNAFVGKCNLLTYRVKM